MYMSGCDIQVGVKYFYGQELRARIRKNGLAKAAVQSGRTRVVKTARPASGCRNSVQEHLDSCEPLNTVSRGQV